MGEKIETTTVIIVGSGPSGLSTAAHLHHLSIPYILLEREDTFAPLWQKFCYDRVHLHLDKRFCKLPFAALPDGTPGYMSRADFVDYLTDYVSRFEIKPRYGRRVVEAKHDAESCWYRSRFVVVATGETCDPWAPPVEGLDGFGGEVVHSTEYKNGARFSGERVLVVGAGNSGMEIGLDLANHGAKASIVVRSPMHVITRGMAYVGLVMLKYVPLKWVDFMLTVMSKAVFGDLTNYGIQSPKEGPFTMKVKHGKYPVIDVGTIGMIKTGKIQVLPGISYIKGNKVLFENGKEDTFDAIVMATGFKRPTKQWLKDYYLLNDNGLPRNPYPNHWKGINGLYCAGLAHRGLPGAGMDAQKIAHDIKNQL
ncbi:Probable indole-3-pyruvate monooxygenase YUCCA10 [Striga hermonthica]|uniref:indole-3-pyruvate monooxygenase n=1 Tax=Striga hermonthica TaxID=68872 RepID=A0A9N7REQ6_STRHE|nr:Probable indole-3-pyruvate monooxygenase YUCCA10 [Striga hermonthica]